MNPPPWAGLSSVGSNNGTVLFLFLTPSTGDSDLRPLNSGLTGAWPPTVTSGLSVNWTSLNAMYYWPYWIYGSGKDVQVQAMAEQLGIHVHGVNEGQLAQNSSLPFAWFALHTFFIYVYTHTVRCIALQDIQVDWYSWIFISLLFWSILCVSERVWEQGYGFLILYISLLVVYIFCVCS